MIQIQFLDKNGKDINPGDWVKVYCRSCGISYSIFYLQFQIRDDYIIPHDTFSWECIEKINIEDIPLGVCKSASGEYYYQEENEEAKESDHRLHFVIGLGEIRDRVKSYIIKEVAV